MNARVVVDPVTRIEGHLRIEAQMEGNKIDQAYSSGTMVRGIEIILQGRDPRDAWAVAQRICDPLCRAENCRRLRIEPAVSPGGCPAGVGRGPPGAREEVTHQRWRDGEVAQTGREVIGDHTRRRLDEDESIFGIVAAHAILRIRV